MRILFVLHTFPPESWGGTELHVQGVARALSKRHEVRVFTRCGDSQKPHGHVDHGFQAGLFVTRFNNLYEDFESFESTWKHRASHEAFLEEVESYRPDVVHIHHLTGLSITVIEALKSRGIPVVFSLHDFWTTCPRGQRLHPEGTICEEIDRVRCHACLKGLWPDWFEDLAEDATMSPVLAPWEHEMRRALDLCDILLTPSAFHRDRMIETTQIDPRKFVALAHGLDHDMFGPPKDPHPKPRVIGYIGSVIPTKGVHTLIEAFNRLKGDFRLEIWGHAPIWHEKEDYLGDLRAKVAIPGRVQFMGAYDNNAVPSILERLDILVVPSLWWETFSLTIREAMLAGIPIVASDLGAMREAIANSKAGLVFEAESPGALARSIMRLVEDQKLRVECASQRLQVKTLEQNAADYEILYSQATSIAAERRGKIAVSESSFPKKTSETGAKGAPKDLSVSIEKVGGGDVQVRSSVKRGEQTQVSFVFDYGPSDENSEIHLTVDFAQSGTGTSSPSQADASAQPKAEEEKPVIPKEARTMAEQAQLSQTKKFENKAQEEAMYKLDQEIFPRQVEALDDMVKKTHLAKEDQKIENRRPNRSRERTPREERPGRDGGDRNTRARRDDRGGDRPSSERRPSRHREGGVSEGRGERPRARRDESAGRGDRNRGEERPRRERQDDRPPRGRDQRPRREDTDRRPRQDRTERPAPQSQPKSQPKPKKEAPKELTHDQGEVVWGGQAGWKLPETSAPAPRAKPDRAPNHRTGKQPSVKTNQDDSSGFGDGV